MSTGVAPNGVTRKTGSEEETMNPQAINWVQLLRRVGENAHQLETLAQLVGQGAISFEHCFAELLSDGFTIPEAQELYSLLQA